MPDRATRTKRIAQRRKVPCLESLTERAPAAPLRKRAPTTTYPRARRARGPGAAALSQAPCLSAHLVHLASSGRIDIMKLSFLALALAVLSCSGLRVQPGVNSISPHSAMASRLGVPPKMQFGGGPPSEQQGLSRENEPEEYFKTNMDDMTDAEKIKSPVVIGGLALLIGPFIIGASEPTLIDAPFAPSCLSHMLHPCACSRSPILPINSLEVRPHQRATQAGGWPSAPQRDDSIL